jgi:hypothetical protein
MSVCLSECIIAALAGRISMKFGYGGQSRKSVEKNQIWTKISGNVRFTVAGDINSPQNHCCATLGILIHLTVTCSSVIHRVFIVAFLLKHWLRERSRMLRNTYTALFTDFDCRLLQTAEYNIHVFIR